MRWFPLFETKKEREVSYSILKNLENRVLSGWKIKIYFSQIEVSLLEWDDPQIYGETTVTHFFSHVRQWTLHGWDDAIFTSLFHTVPFYTQGFAPSGYPMSKL